MAALALGVFAGDFLHRRHGHGGDREAEQPGPGEHHDHDSGDHRPDRPTTAPGRYRCRRLRVRR
jgi:hypothetical protein